VKVSGYLRMLKALALGAQRWNAPLPEPIRRPLRALLASVTKYQTAEPDIQDWSTPLIIGAKVMADPNVKVCLDHSPPAQANSALSMVGAGVQQHSGNKRDHIAGMRCLLVTSCLDAGGMDEVVVFLARRLPRNNIRVAVLHASPAGGPNGAPTGKLGRLLLAQGVETVELAGTSAARWLEAWRPDVISVHGAPMWVLQVARRLSIPCVETLHGMHSLFEADAAAVAERGQQLAGIVAVSELVRRQYLNLNRNFPLERIVTIPNGVDDSRRRPGDRHSARLRWGIGEEYIFLCLARHCLQKNTYGLVAAFDEVAARHPEAHLVIAGPTEDPVYFAQVMRFRAGLASRDRIHLRDYSSNPAELLALADGFVLNSFFEGWSLASMEALYAGLPVVLSDVGGAQEQVGTGRERGHVIPNPIGDPLQVNWKTIRDARYRRQTNRNALVDAMSSLVANRASWLAARQQLSNESAQRFDSDLCVRSHARVLAAARNGEQCFEGCLPSVKGEFLVSSR
jgi:glycosyltransferase involved in cell wall biosynthesis